MTYQKNVITKIEGKRLEKWTLTNKQGVQIDVLNYGATWYDWRIPFLGEKKSIIYQPQDPTNCIDDPFHIGHTIGRVAGRIPNGCFIVDNEKYQLPLNCDKHVLHSTSIKGFDNYFWDVHYQTSPNSESLILTKMITNDGFPGVMQATIEYCLLTDGTVEIVYTGISDEKTLFDPTTHVYFNLNDNKSIEDMQITINSKYHLELYDDKIPTGNFEVNTDGYLFNGQQLQQNLQQLSYQLDDAFVVTPNETNIELQQGQVQVTITGDRNAAVIFAASPQNEKEITALAVEMQTLPCSMKYEQFGDIYLPKNKKQTYKTIFKACLTS